MYRHLFLRGNYQQTICYDAFDYINFFNRIILSAYSTNIWILALEILGNHFHIVVEGENIKEFKHHLRMSLTHFFNKRYQSNGTLGTRKMGDALVLPPEVDGGEDLIDTICYVLRNVARHGISTRYLDYKWSTVRVAFSKMKLYGTFTGETAPSNLVENYLPYPYEIPPGMRMTSEGIILPHSVMDLKLLEHLFIDRTNYLAILSKETRREVEYRQKEEMNNIDKRSPRVKDELISDYIIKHIEQVSSQDRNAPKNIFQMTLPEKRLLACKVMDAIPACTPAQLARIIGVPYITVYKWVKS